jgi:hypothetical protein
MGGFTDTYRQVFFHFLRKESRIKSYDRLNIHSQQHTLHISDKKLKPKNSSLLGNVDNHLLADKKLHPKRPEYSTPL